MKHGFAVIMLIGATLVAGCSGKSPPVIINKSPNGIDLRGGISVDTMTPATLHCQYYGKLAQPAGIERVGTDNAIFHYTCQ